MTLAHDAAASAGVVAPRARPRNRATRLRTCAECGKVEEVRADNPATRCRACGGRPALEKGHRARSAKRNRETCRHSGRDFPAPPSSRQQFCSRACRGAARSVERTCVTCGIAFRIPRSTLSGHTNASGRFCSRLANVAVGYGVAVMTQILIFPIFGLHTTLAHNLKMGAASTLVSIARSFVLRQLFEWIRVASRSGGRAGHGEPAPTRR